jgi:hypothetical protein
MLAVGKLLGYMHIYDAHVLQIQRSYNNAHTQRIGAEFVHPLIRMAQLHGAPLGRTRGVSMTV